MYALAALPVPRIVRAGGMAMRVLRVGSVAVIAAPAAAPEIPIEDALRRRHAIVLELAEQVDPLLPARFGSRLSAARVTAGLRPSVPALVKALEHVRGRRQMTVRLIGPPLKGPRQPAGTGTAYLAQRRSAAFDVPKELEPLSIAVEPFVVDRRMQPGRAEIRGTLFHLVPRDAVGAYREAFDAALPSIAPWKAVATGPWPPFAFAPELLE